MERSCPRCSIKLVPEDGAGERCPSCGGHHLDVELAGPLLEREVGRTIDDLRALAAHFAGERLPCLGCGGNQSPVTLRGVPVDLCLSCGALWLDAGELSALTGGRTAERPPPDAAPRPQPQRPPPTSSSGDLAGVPLPEGAATSRWFGLLYVAVLLPAVFLAVWASGSAVRALAVVALGLPIGGVFLLSRRIVVDEAGRRVREVIQVGRWALSERSLSFERVQKVYVETLVGHSRAGQYEVYRLRVAGLGLDKPLQSWLSRDPVPADIAAAYLARILGMEPERRVELSAP